MALPGQQACTQAQSDEPGLAGPPGPPAPPTRSPGRLRSCATRSATVELSLMKSSARRPASGEAAPSMAAAAAPLAAPPRSSRPKARPGGRPSAAAASLRPLLAVPLAKRTSTLRGKKGGRCRWPPPPPPVAAPLAVAPPAAAVRQPASMFRDSATGVREGANRKLQVRGPAASAAQARKPAKRSLTAIPRAPRRSSSAVKAFAGDVMVFLQSAGPTVRSAPLHLHGVQGVHRSARVLTGVLYRTTSAGRPGSYRCHGLTGSSLARAITAATLCEL